MRPSAFKGIFERPASTVVSSKSGRQRASANEKLELVIARRNLLLAILTFVSALAITLAAFAADMPHSRKADEQAGAFLFQQQDCAHCHGPEGIGGKKAPPLTNMHKNKVWTSEKITRQILNGGLKMPPFGDSLTDPQVAQLVAYLTTKHKPKPPPVPPNEPAKAPAVE